VAQVAEHLPSKTKALSSSPKTAKKNFLKRSTESKNRNTKIEQKQNNHHGEKAINISLTEMGKCLKNKDMKYL
jgi:hypothetical protein